LKGEKSLFFLGSFWYNQKLAGQPRKCRKKLELQGLGSADINHGREADLQVADKFFLQPPRGWSRLVWWLRHLKKG